MTDESIILVKLITEEQFIGVLAEEDDTGLRLENPMRLEVVYHEHNPNKPDVIVLPWDELSKMNDVHLEKMHVLYYTIPKDDITEFYKKQIKKKMAPVEEPEIPFDRNIVTAMLERMTSNTSVH